MGTSLIRWISSLGSEVLEARLGFRLRWLQHAFQSLDEGSSQTIRARDDYNIYI